MNNLRKEITLFALTAGTLFGVFCGWFCDENAKIFRKETGKVFGTSYTIIYELPSSVEPLGAELTELFHAIDLSLSTFNQNSVISRVNRNDSTVVLDEYFRTVFETGQRVSEITNGAFDMTVAPLVNAWGFGFDPQRDVTSAQIDSLMEITGYEKIRIEGDRIVKDNPAIMLDASAIAKGYACDVVAAFLDAKGCEDYMIEIGGEVVVKGHNERGTPWTIGIIKPIDDKTMMHSELQSIVYLENGGMATSGNYRQYYHKNGRKYSHIINPRTGYPVENNLLSSTVIAPNCMLADAYATAFIVMGLEESLLLANFISEIEAYFIYIVYSNVWAEKYTGGFKKYLTPPVESEEKE